MRDITALGGTMLVTVVTVVSVLAFLFHKKRAATPLVMAGSCCVLGPRARRPSSYVSAAPGVMPGEACVYSAASFPSGHSTMSTAAFLTLAMLVASLEPRRRSKVLGLHGGGAVRRGGGLQPRLSGRPLAHRCAGRLVSGLGLGPGGMDRAAGAARAHLGQG